MSFNVGVIVGVKPSRRGGGVFTVSHIDGPSHRVSRGLTGRPAPLDVWTHPSSPRRYPIDHKFDADGIALVPFLWDAASMPQTTTTRGGQISTRFAWLTKFGSTPTHGTGDLRWFSNLGDVRRMSPHFTMPTIPIRRLNDAAEKAEQRARQLYGVINSLSRIVIAGMVIV